MSEKNDALSRAKGAAMRLIACEPKDALRRWLFGGALAVLLCGLVGLLNLSTGALGNLNDIGGWQNRLIFLVMAAGVQGLLLLLVTAMHRGSYARLALRELIMTAGFYIQLLAINQKTYAFVEVMLPMIRAMDAGGLAAIGDLSTNLSSPALTLLYAVTRGPVYDMYMVKLLCILALCALAVLAMVWADRQHTGIRAEVLLSLCLILPQGFMSASCAAQLDVVCVALLAASLTCATAKRPRAVAAAVLYGLACAMSGFALYALPAWVLLIRKKTLRPAHLALAALVAVACCLPAALCGQGMGGALASLLRANLGLPEYASGSPNLVSMFPRYAMEEMPEAFILGRLPNIDAETNFSPYYTQEGFEAIMRGMALACLALYGMAAAFLSGRKGMSGTARALALSLAACLLCPGVTAGAWLLPCAIGLLAIVTEPQLRLASCAVLFATAGAAAYPVTGEILLPMVAALALCLLALFDLLGMFDGLREGGLRRE